MNPLIELRNVDKSFTKAKPVLQNIRLEIHGNECLVIVGHNGAGKSTLLKLIAGLTVPTRGNILYAPGVAIGYAPEHFPKIRFRAEEYLYALGRMRRIPKPALRERIRELTELFDLHASGPITQFSKGMAQKVNLMQAVLGKPDVFILDEPFSGLDAAAQAELSRLLQRFKREGMAIVLTCHEPALSDPIADRVVVLQNGGIVSDQPHQRRKKGTWYKIVCSPPEISGGDSTWPMNVLPPGMIRQGRHANEFYVAEHDRDAVLLELLKRGGAVLSVAPLAERTGAAELPDEPREVRT